MIALFHFYLRYIWQHTDFSDFQTWIYNTIEFGRQQLLGASTGLKISCPGGLSVTATAGQGFGSLGRLLILTSDTTVTFASPVGNPARSLVVLRPVDTDADNVTTPVNPTPQPLHIVRTAQLVVIDGTPGSTPVYPAIQPGDLILAGFLISAGASSVTLANVETYKRDVPVPFERRIRTVTATYTVDNTDDIVEVNTATVNLPASPGPYEGKMWTFINLRAAGNSVTVSGNGNNVSGQSTQVLDDQYASCRVYCNGTAYYLI